jgi:hypothetical protein
MKRSLLFKSFVSAKSEESNEMDKYQYLSTPDILISEHIAKSLSFKETSLNKELSKNY